MTKPVTVPGDYAGLHDGEVKVVESPRQAAARNVNAVTNPHIQPLTLTCRAYSASTSLILCTALSTVSVDNCATASVDKPAGVSKPVRSLGRSAAGVD